MRNLIVGLAALAAISGSTSLLAAPLAYDGFGDYPSGKYLGGVYHSADPANDQAPLSGGFGFSGAWKTGNEYQPNYVVSTTASPTYSSGSLSLATQAGYATSNNEYTPGASHTFDTSVTSATGVAGTTVYTSFLMSTPNAYTSDSSFALYNGASSVFRIGKDWEAGNSYGGYPDGNVHFYVLKLAYDTTGSVAQTLFVDPSLAAEPSTGGIDLGTTTAFKFDSYKLYVEYSKPMVFDELRVGLSYSDVTPVPEPVMVSLVALSGLFLASRRRRQV